MKRNKQKFICSALLCSPLLPSLSILWRKKTRLSSFPESPHHIFSPPAHAPSPSIAAFASGGWIAGAPCIWTIAGHPITPTSSPITNYLKRRYPSRSSYPPLIGSSGAKKRGASNRSALPCRRKKHKKKKTETFVRDLKGKVIVSTEITRHSFLFAALSLKHPIIRSTRGTTGKSTVDITMMIRVASEIENALFSH